VQQEGIKAAKQFWDISPLRQSLFPNVSDIFEKMIDFYRNLGFVPFTSYEEVVKENKQLEEENQFLTLSRIPSASPIRGRPSSDTS
jgi:hypothetical protein